MAFSCFFRSSLARARATALISPAFMDCRKSFTLNPSMLASSGSHHNNHHLSSSTLFRFFSAQTTPKERESELLNKETTFGDEKGKQSGLLSSALTQMLIWVPVALVVFLIEPKLAKFTYEEAVEGMHKGRFEEFKLHLLEPGFVSKIVVDHSLALVYLKDSTEVKRVFKSGQDCCWPGYKLKLLSIMVLPRRQPIEKGIYLLFIKSPESFKEELEQTQKILRLEPVPVIDVTKKYPVNVHVGPLGYCKFSRPTYSEGSSLPQ